MFARSARGHYSGFTLVELLVVIGVVAVLIALLMPALNGVRRQARLIVCLSNLRQLGQAFQIYVNENKGKSLQYVQQTSLLELEDLLIRDRAKGQQSPVVFCPEASESPVRIQEPGDPTYYYPGATFRPWGYPDAKFVADQPASPFRGSSYGMNGWVTQLSPTHVLSSTERHEYVTLPARMGDQVPLFADSTGERGYPRHTDPPPRTLNPHKPQVAYLYAMDHIFCIPRHGRAINVVFLDGHAQTVPPPELWKLRWNNVWEPTDVQMPPN